MDLLTFSGYSIEEEIGQGSSAIVFKAVQESLDRPMAIKVLKSSIEKQSMLAKRFLKEAHFMSSMHHGNIISIYDLLKENGKLGIVMEFVDGINLSELLEQVNRLPADIATIILLQVAQALDYAHFRGIIHRDIKPSNILISKKGEIKLTDFGIARDGSHPDQTETGAGLGTPSYMSPEQILGEKLDFRSDVFSLGIVYYQMLTGEKPFQDEATRTVMQKIRLDPYPFPKRFGVKLPRKIEQILSRCLEKKRQNRFSSTQRLIDDLVDVLSAEVHSSHRVRIVTFFEQMKIINSNEARRSLLPAQTIKNAKIFKSDTRFFPQTLTTQVGFFLLIFFLGFWMQKKERGTTHVFSQSSAGDKTAESSQLGSVKVVIDPWAEVWINGEKKWTSPQDQFVDLPVGEHWFQFRNPYYQPQDQKVLVEPNMKKVLYIKLESLKTSEAEKQ